MYQKIIKTIIYLVSLTLFFFIDNNTVKLLSLFILFTILIFDSINYLIDKKYSLLMPIISTIILILVIITYSYKPFSGIKKINNNEYITYVRDTNNKLHSLNGKLTIFEKNGVELIKIKSEDSSINTKEYSKNLIFDNMSINILSEDSYKTGANVIFLKNNITNESQEYSLSNNGEIKLENNIKINMLDKKDDFNGLGKAIQISYNFPKSKRNYEQWLYKDYKEFNLITSSDDPFTLIYNNDEFKKIYNAKITFIPPYQKQIFYATILLSLLFLTLPFFRKKNEN